MLKPIVSDTQLAQFQSDAGTIVSRGTQRIEASQFDATRAADFRFELPIEKLQPGPHLLTIEATMKGMSARRDVRFVVR